MKNSPYKVILIRHAQSIKNIKKIHGGSGEELTACGKAQALNIVNVIKDAMDISTLKIFSSTSYHTQATANIIGEALNIAVEKPLQFRPLNLGIADGLSESELEKVDYRSHQLFAMWRRREIDIKGLKILQMESYMEFWDRGVNLLQSVAFDGSSLMVCSNSLMILLSHIMMNNHPETTDRYRHISINNCDLIVFNTSDYASFELDREMTTVDDIMK